MSGFVKQTAQTPRSTHAPHANACSPFDFYTTFMLYARVHIEPSRSPGDAVSISRLAGFENFLCRARQPRSARIRWNHPIATSLKPLTFGRLLPWSLSLFTLPLPSPSALPGFCLRGTSRHEPRAHATPVRGSVQAWPSPSSRAASPAGRRLVGASCSDVGHALMPAYGVVRLYGGRLALGRYKCPCWHL